ncbi:MAG: glycosyl hydrolase family 28 protein [Bacteroidetes bacterium]|nr:glycosyl hydrolase family 28 protein [Bacteroidota bacterium]
MKKNIVSILFFSFLTTFIIPLAYSNILNDNAGMTVYASQNGARLNSNVYLGGGDDDTEALQAILDRAPALGRLHLVLDGAARISKTLRVHSNTTIECPNKSCGLFLSDSSNCNVLNNADLDMEVIRNQNITLIGGVYNNNKSGQVHHRDESTNLHIVSNLVMGMWFCGVENLLLRDVTIANQSSWAILVANWKYVTMENIHIDRRERVDHHNQDGLHFWGPGRFLTLRNIYGNVGDDFIALAPDENDMKSSIEDVLIQGIQLEDADQGIRLLVRAEGKLDRVIIRDVTGTYKSYGFYISPWFRGNGGNYGNIVFDMIDLRPMKNNYEYTPPFLFKICGNIESLTLKNIYQHTPDYNHQMFLIGGHYVYDHRPDRPATAEHPTKIRKLIVDGLYIDEQNEAGVPESYFKIKNDIDFLSINNVILQRNKEIPEKSAFIKIESGTIGILRMNNVSVSGLKKLIDAPENAIRSKKLYNVDRE